MRNREVAELFYEVADILEFHQVEWKPRAYRKAAQMIETWGIYRKNLRQRKGGETDSLLPKRNSGGKTNKGIKIQIDTKPH